jgi:hypothetical protein
MKTWREKFHAMAMAVAFAETGEWETAKSFVDKTQSRPKDRPAALKKRPERKVRRQTYQA